MKTGFALDYPIWMLLLCCIVGAGYALGLYYKNKKTTFQPKWTANILAIFRFLTVSIICMLLLSIVYKQYKSQIEKPIILLAHDNSSSIKFGFKTLDSSVYRKSIFELKEKLSEKYEVKFHTFGLDLSSSDSLNYKEPATDISQALTALYDLYDNQNVGAIVLASDGIINKGQDPSYNNKFKIPFYTLALGDTTTRKDLKIATIFANKTVYLGDKSSVQIGIEAQQCKNESTTLTLQQVNAGNKVIAQQQVSINSDAYKYGSNYTLDATKAGLQHYRATLQTIEGELTTANNSKDFYIEVIDEKQKVLLLSSAPHPDIAAIKSACESLKNYEVTADFMLKYTGSTVGYDMVILHNLPSAKYPISAILSEITTNKTSSLFVVGTQTNLATFNQAQSLLKIAGNGTVNEVTAFQNTNFVSYTTDAVEMSTISGLPALLAPFGNYTLSGNANVLLFQKIGAIVSKNPLLCYIDEDNKKTGVLCGENIWKWKLGEYQKTNTHQATNNLITKTIQYLTVKQNKNPFRLNISKNTYLVNETVHFDAELFNDSKELINASEVKLTTTDDYANQKEHVMNKNAKSYYLDLNNLSEGSYSYTANTQLNGKTFTASGTFNISGLALESINTKADHNLLYKLSQSSGGRLFYPQYINALADSINANATIKPVLYSQFSTAPIINLKWIFFLLLTLLSVEWFMRKYAGGY